MEQKAMSPSDDAPGAVDNIAQLPRPKKSTRRDVPLEVVHRHHCQHGHFLVDEKAAEVECGLCHEKLNPLWVLNRLAIDDWRLRHDWAFYRAEVKLLRERLRTKCKHCGHMTDISSNVRTFERDALIEKILAGEDDNPPSPSEARDE